MQPGNGILTMKYDFLDCIFVLLLAVSDTNPTAILLSYNLC